MRKTLFFLFLIVSSIVGISMRNFFLIWRIIEINLLLFIPILRLTRLNSYPSLVGLKYFFIQSLGSIIFFITVSVSILIYFNREKISILITLRLLLKLGIPPFHIWLFNFIIDLDWKLFFIIASWQKILPFFMLRQVILENIDFIIILGLIICMGLSFNYSRIKILLINSSIFTSMWIISSIIFIKILWLYLYILYRIILLFCVLIFFNYKINLIENNNYFRINLINKINVFLLLLSMAGLPPFLGFYIKLIILLVILFYTKYFLAISIVFCSVFLIYIYLRFFLNSLAIQSVNYKNYIQFKSLNYFSILIVSYSIRIILFFIW